MGTASIKILHIASGDVWGGAESQLFGLLRALGKNGDFDSTVITLNHGLLTDRLSDAGVTCFVIEESKHNAFQLWRALRRQIRTINPDCVHTHGYKQNILGALVAMGLHDCQCIRTQHGDWEIPDHLLSRSTLYRAIDWLTARFLQDRIVAVSEALAAVLKRHLPQDKITVIENGVDTKVLSECSRSPIDRSQRDNFVIAFVGRLVPVKRIDLFLEAAAIITNQIANSVSFKVFGDGPSQPEAIALAERLGISDSVRFCGFAQDLPQHLANSDLLVMTSDHEGLPMVLLEALYLKVPVVAPNVGGIPKILSSDFGVLVSEQSPQAYADAVTNCIRRDHALAKSMERAPAFIEQNYSANRQARYYKHLYRNVVSQN